MKGHTVTLQENVFQLFQAIQKIGTNSEKKESLIEELVRQIEEFITSETLSAKDIIKLPPGERQKILAEQFQEAEQLYKEHPDLIVPDVDAPIDY